MIGDQISQKQIDLKCSFQNQVKLQISLFLYTKAIFNYWYSYQLCCKDTIDGPRLNIWESILL